MKRMILICTLMLGLTTAFGQANMSTLWARKVGSTGNESVLALKTDNSGNQYVTGYFSNTVDFDPGAGVVNLTSAGAYDIFVCKFDPNGTLLWAKNIGSSGNDVAWGLALDAFNNIHITGYFSGSVDFDPGAGTSSMTALALDIFVLKLDVNGNFIWSRKMGGSGNDQTYDIALDASGNIYTTGYYSNSADFDPGAGTFNLSVGSLSVEAAFISVLNSAGNFVSAKQITGSDALTRGLRIRLDNSANVYLCGYFGGTVDFDPNAGTVNMTALGTEDAYVLKLNSSLNYVWARRTGGNDIDRANGMDVDGNGNIILSGQFVTTVDFDPGAGTFNMTSVNSNDIYVQKLDPSGNFLWAKSMGGISEEYGLVVEVLPNNELLIAGQFYGTVDFDPGAGTFNMTSSGAQDIFVARLDANGNYLIAKKLGGSGIDYLNNLADFGSNILFVAGYFENTVDFDINAGVMNLSSAGTRDAFLTKWDYCTAPPSSPGSISGSNLLCSGVNGTYSIVAVGGASSYTWTLPAGWSGSSNSNSISTTSGSSGTIMVSASNGCGTTPQSSLNVTVNTAPATPGTISGSSTICVGANSTYSVAAVAGATSYTWTLPSGWTGTSTTNSISTTAGSSGAITVSATNTCGTSAVSTFNVTTNTAPAAPGAISGNTTLCQFDNATYSIAPVAGATSYTWTLPGGWTGSSTSPTLNAVASDQSGIISVTAGNSCGTSSATSLNITVNVAPQAPVFVAGVDSLCAGETALFSINAVSNASAYTWSFTGGLSGSSSTTDINVLAGTLSGTVQVSASNTCGSSSTSSYPVVVSEIPAVYSNDVTICEGDQAELEAGASAGLIYWYDVPNGGAALGSGPNYVTGPLFSDTVLYVEGNNNGCVSAPRLAVNITVNPMPNTGVTVANNVLNADQTNATLYQWLDCNANYAPLAGTSISFTPAQNGSYAVMINLNGCVDTSACQVINTIGLEEQSATQLALYPNPSSEKLYIEISAGIREVEIIDVSGARVLKESFTAEESVELTPTLNPGVYLVRVSDAAGNHHITHWIRL